RRYSVEDAYGDRVRSQCELWMDFGDLIDVSLRPITAKAAGHLLVAQPFSEDRHLIDQPLKTAVGAASHRATDPDRVIIDDRRPRRRPAHVPLAADLLFVQPASNARRIAKT